MSKKFAAQRARDASLARKNIEACDSIPSTPRMSPTGPSAKSEEREKTGLLRVSEYQGRPTADLIGSRIEHIASILDMELQLELHALPGVSQVTERNWRDTTLCALRHRKVNLRIIEEVLKTRQESTTSTDSLFRKAVEEIFDESDVADVWARVRQMGGLV